MSNLFDKKDVFSWSNCEEAKKYLGEEGYFCDDYQEDLAAWSKGLLRDVDQSLLVDCIFEDDENNVHGLFLPACKVRQARSPHWRPLKDYDEFIGTVGRDLGDGFGMRRKNLPTGIVHIVLVTEFHQELNTIGLGTCTYSYKELYDNYEWYDEKTEKWMPFGVEE